MSKKTKILFIIKKINYFGATSNSLDLITNLNYKNYNSKVLIEDLEIHDFNSSFYYSKLRELSINYFFLNKLFPVTRKFHLKIYYYLRKFSIVKKYSNFLFGVIVRSYNPDFFYFNYIPNIDNDNLKKVFKNKVILHIHLQLNKLKTLSDNQKKSLLKAHKILTYNTEAISILSKFANKNKFVNFELSLNFNKINHLKKIVNIDSNKVINRIQSFKNDNYLVVANFASFTLRKGADIFCEVANQTNKYNKKIVFIWMGLGNDEDNIYVKYSNVKNIIFFPKINNIFPILQQIDILMINSRDEGGPTLLLEGMYFNKICLTHVDCGFSKRVLEDNINGICLSNNYPKSYTEKILKLYDHPNNFTQIQFNAHKKILKNYDILSKITNVTNILN